MIKAKLYIAIFIAAIAIFLVNAEDPVKCGRDITQATADLTAAGLKIAVSRYSSCDDIRWTHCL
jgi:hypothetical protein